jgi:hypothetical protein
MKNKDSISINTNLIKTTGLRTSGDTVLRKPPGFQHGKDPRGLVDVNTGIAVLISSDLNFL